MTPLSMRISLIALAVVAVIGAAAAAAVAVTVAPTLHPSPVAASATAGSKYCESFFGHLGSDLGKSQDEIKNAVNKAIDQTLADAVHNGKLTQAQADQLKNKVMQNGGGCQALATLRALLGKGRAAAVSFGIEAAAKALNISTAELKQDVAAGKTLHQIADSKGISEDQLKRSVKADFKQRLDTAVKNGKLTQAQEDNVLAQIDQVVNAAWDQPLQHGLNLPARKKSPSPAAAQ